MSENGEATETTEAVDAPVDAGETTEAPADDSAPVEAAESTAGEDSGDPDRDAIKKNMAVNCRAKEARKRA